MMNKLCVKSALLGAIIMLLIFIAMGATTTGSSGKYQIFGTKTNWMYLLNTQTGQVKPLHYDDYNDKLEAYKDVSYTADF